MNSTAMFNLGLGCTLQCSKLMVGTPVEYVMCSPEKKMIMSSIFFFRMQIINDCSVIIILLCLILLYCLIPFCIAILTR